MQEAIKALEWHLISGVDEAIEDKPRDYTKTERITMKEENAPKTSLLGPKQLEEKARLIADNCNTIEELKNALLNFEGLSIKKTATNTVFSDGNPNAKIMAIGEAPGANEDLQGIPFCGMSGQLLDKMFAAISLSREENIYITNSVFWRPPGNRRPTPEESAICLPFVEKHIALMNPKLLILVGSTSAQALLNITETISKLRKSTHHYTNRYLKSEIPVRIIFHPSYLLRQPSQKKLAWEDLLIIKNEYLAHN